MIRNVLLDLSGTLHVGNEPACEGMVQALARLKQRFEVAFLTNTTKESRAVLIQRLRALGLDQTLLPEARVFTSLSAVKMLLQKHGWKCPLALLSEDARLELSEGVEQEADRGFDCVVVGLNEAQLGYEPMNQAFRVLNEWKKGAEEGSPVPLIAAHKGRYYMREDGLALGPGAFIAGLEYALGIEAQLVGKPCAAFFQGALTAL